VQRIDPLAIERLDGAAHDYGNEFAGLS